MKRILIVVACALAACEGEPPKVPAGAPPVVVLEEPAVAPPSAEDAHSAKAASPPAVAPGPCCNCCPKESDGGSVAAVDGAAPSEAPPPVEVVKASLAGTVTTAPAGNDANAVVYLVDAPVEPSAKKSLTVDNHMMTFAPYVAVIPVGGRVVFHNSDPFPHNVFSPDNEKFNLGNIVQGAAVTHTFKTPGSYTLLCNLHPGMIGYVVAAPSSYFGKTDRKGHYAIKDVPPGTYKVVAWAPRQQPLEQSATIAGADVTLDFQLHR